VTAPIKGSSGVVRKPCNSAPVGFEGAREAENDGKEWTKPVPKRRVHDGVEGVKGGKNGTNLAGISTIGDQGGVHRVVW
jgi:hypothetical protein